MHDKQTPRPSLVAALLALSVILWGVMYIPANKHRKKDGIIFQFHMSIGIMVMGFVLQVSWALYFHLRLGNEDGNSLSLGQGIFYINGFGILGGFFWGISNVFVLISIKFLGLGVGFTLYHVVNMIFGYLIGRLSLFGVEHENKLNLITDLSQVLNLAALGLILFVETKPAESAKKSLRIEKEGSEKKVPKDYGATGSSVDPKSDPANDVRNRSRQSKASKKSGNDIEAESNCFHHNSEVIQRGLVPHPL